MRIYMSEVGTPNTVEANELLLNIVSEAERVKETLDEKGYGDWVVDLHNNMRENMDLPNKIFSIRTYENKTKAEFIFFDKEPDRKYYKVFIEERDDGYVPYIEVSWTRVWWLDWRCMNRYYKFSDGFFTYYINVDTGEKKLMLDKEDICVESKLDDFVREK